MLLPPDLRDWVPNDHLIHFVIDAIDTCSEQIKHRGTGHRQYPPLGTFRRKNAALMQRAFTQILEMATHCGVLKVGQVTVAIDGTKIWPTPASTLP